MLNKTWFGLPLWSVLAPLVACATLVLAWGPAPSALLIALVAAVLIAAVLVAVHHAEVIAHRIGEPLGTLVLAVAVTVIEVALIVSMMLPGGEGAGALARDTVFAAVMIVCNGVIGLCLVAGGMRHRVLTFRIDGTGPALSVLAALSTLTLIVPDYTLTTPGPLLSTAQLLFVGVVSRQPVFNVALPVWCRSRSMRCSCLCRRSATVIIFCRSNPTPNTITRRRQQPSPRLPVPYCSSSA